MKSIKKTLFKFIFIPDYILDSIVYELESFLGRTFTGTLKLDKDKTCYLNLGCGGHIINGFINVDFFFRPKADFGADLRYPLRIPDSSVDGILCEHTMEHLTYAQNELLFKECFRVLKPGKILRVIVPDISLFIQNYVSGNSKWFKSYEKYMLHSSNARERQNRIFATPMQAISFVTQEYNHVACWDFETLKYSMEKTGFKEIEKVAHKRGKNQDLLHDTDDPGRRHVSVYVEATKP